jgi:hypothetical protein
MLSEWQAAYEADGYDSFPEKRKARRKWVKKWLHGDPKEKGDLKDQGGLVVACRRHAEAGCWCDHAVKLLQDVGGAKGPEQDESRFGAKELNEYNFEVGDISTHQVQMIRLHLACTRALVETKDKRQWTSGQRPADDLKKALQKTDEIPFGDAFCLFGDAFWMSVCHYLSAGTGRELRGEEACWAWFPVVLSSSGDDTSSKDNTSSKPVRLARFTFETLDGKGNGRVFLHPGQAFQHLGTEFRKTFGHARACALHDLEWSEEEDLPDIRVRIKCPEVDLRYYVLQGTSAGGALYLGLRSAWTGTPIEGGLVTSLALSEESADGESSPDGNCYPVGQIEQKLTRLQGAMRALIAEDQEGVDALRNETGVQIAAADTLKAAWDIATGRLEDVEAYLNRVVEEADEAALWLAYGHGDEATYKRSLPDVRVRMRISTKPLENRPHPGAENVLIQDPESLYRFRQGLSGGMEPNGQERLNGEPREEQTYEDKDWSEISESGLKRGIVIGDPGMGKSWLLQWQARELAQEALRQLGTEAKGDRPEENGDEEDTSSPQPKSPDEIVLPLRLYLPALADKFRKNGRELSDAILKLVRKSYKDYTRNVKTIEGLVRDRLDEKGGKGLYLLLDALDEVGQDDRQEVENALRDLKDKPDLRMLVTSRSVGYSAPWSVMASEEEREMELLPFNDDQTKEFVEGFFKSSPEKAERLLEMLDGSVQVRGMSQVPLLLTFLCLLFDKDDDNKQVDYTTATRAEIYEEIVLRLLQGDWKRDESGRTVSRDEAEERRQELAEIAFLLFLKEKRQFDAEDFQRMVMKRQFCAQDFRRMVMNCLDYIRGKAKDRLKAYVGETNILVRSGNGPYMFIHLTIHEYLTAYWIKQQVNWSGWANTQIKDASGTKIDVETLIDRKAWSPYWQQVLLLLAGQLPDPVPMLQLLADKERDDIYRHRLALATHCAAEALLAKER